MTIIQQTAQRISGELRSMGFTAPFRTDGEGARETALIAAIRGKRPNRENLEISIGSDGVSINDAAPVAVEAAILDLKARYQSPHHHAAPKSRGDIMRRAWQIAREGSARFGGSAREYLSSAMTQAWAESR